MSINDKITQHRAFWSGKGPSLLLTPAAKLALYDTKNYGAMYENPRKLWGSEYRRALTAVDWPTDGIATVRPNLGTTFIPTQFGQEVKIIDDQMPWSGAPITPEAILEMRGYYPLEVEVVQKAIEFFDWHAGAGNPDIVAYMPDTQSPLNILQMLRGQDVLCQMADPACEESVTNLLDTCTEAMLCNTFLLKEAIEEPFLEMVHGHGTPQGIYFPQGGIRICEDSATLLSPAMIEKFILPQQQRLASIFGGAFIHFCGYHPKLLELVTASPTTVALDLGNPEMYDTLWVMQQCAAGEVVLYSRLAAELGENWLDYIRRIATMVRETGVRMALVPDVYPSDLDEAAMMLETWHELTLPLATPT